MRRTRRLHPQREALVGGILRLTYEQFFERCDRWSTALQSLGIEQGDRVAYIAPNVHQQLESFYAVPQIGAVLVPINFRLATDDFAYIIEHSGSTVVCATDEYLESVDSIRDRIPRVKHFVALTGNRAGWLDYETVLEEVAVVGVPHERWGEAPSAFVVLKPGQTATEDELREFARARLAHFKVPQW